MKEIEFDFFKTTKQKKDLDIFNKLFNFSLILSMFMVIFYSPPESKNTISLSPAVSNIVEVRDTGILYQDGTIIKEFKSGETLPTGNMLLIDPVDF